MLEFECPHCHELLSIPEQFIGHTGNCRKCGGVITITEKSTHDPNLDAGTFSVDRPPTLVAFHIETSGTSSRKHAIIEIGAVKFTLDGDQTDTFRSLANPGERLSPAKINDTEIDDSMLVKAPPSHEVLKRWFDWIGPHALLFSHDAHTSAKFICAGLLKESVTPPKANIVDVLEWAKQLNVPIPEGDFVALLDYLGFRVARAHKATNFSQGISTAVGFLMRAQVGMIRDLKRTGVLGKSLEGALQPHQEIEIIEYFQRTAKSLESECGPDFFGKVREFTEYARNHRHTRRHKESGHPHEWFETRKAYIAKNKVESDVSDDSLSDIYKHPRHGTWEHALVEATRCTNKVTRQKLCEEAVELGAKDPWPYVRLTSFHIENKDYKTAKKLCEQYFETDAWKDPRWAGSSLKLLDRMEKLERKLTEH